MRNQAGRAWAGLKCFLIVAATVLVGCGGGTSADSPPPPDDAGGAVADSGSVDDSAEQDVAVGPVTCASDKDCAATSRVCDPLTKLCVRCLSDVECAASQHCVNLECQAYTPCTNSLGCKGAKGPDGLEQPICDQTIGECSACTSGADCPASNDCQHKQCVPYTTCQNSTQCGPDEVCEKSINRCVQCLGDNDCGDGALCESGQCRPFTACTSDKQCTVVGMLCDAAKGKCTQCLQNSDCPDIYNCQPVGVAQTGVCVLDLCAQGQGACSSNAKVTCNSVGDAYGSPEACPTETTCVAPGGKPECKVWTCTPGKSCDNDKAVACSDDGLQVTESVDCAATAQKCQGGECKTLLCTPATPFCQGDVIMQCSSDGLTSATAKDCAATEYCGAGTTGDPACLTKVCVPNAPSCNGDVATQCNPKGSGFEAGGTDCMATDKMCSGGACVSEKCGNGLVEGAEQCDDGSDAPLDGCSATCTIECASQKLSGVNNQGITLTQLSWPESPVYTLEIWASIDPSVSGGYDSLFTLAAATPTTLQNSTKVGMYSAAIPSFASKNGRLGWGWAASMDSNSAWNDGKFHHFAFVQDVGERRIYVDGVLDGKTSGQLVLPAGNGTGWLVLGNEGPPPWSCDGGYVCGGKITTFAFRARASAAYTADFVPTIVWTKGSDDIVLWYTNSGVGAVAGSPNAPADAVQAVGASFQADVCPQM